jgi:hypothetical protein
VDEHHAQQGQDGIEEVKAFLVHGLRVRV